MRFPVERPMLKTSMKFWEIRENPIQSTVRDRDSLYRFIIYKTKMAHQDSPSVKETSNGPPESAKSTEAEKAIMEDGDLNKLLQLAQHCSKQMSASDDETKDSNDAIPNSEDTVLAASSLHLPLIEGRSFLDNEKNTKLSSQSNGYINNDGNKSRSTEKALLSLKHQNIDSYKTDEDQNEKGKGAGRRSLAKGPTRPQNKTKPTPTRKKVKQKQSQNELLAAALLRGVTMRPSGKWVSPGVVNVKAFSERIKRVTNHNQYFVASSTILCREISLYWCI